jgi:SAM-dependent methyltransferase
MSHVQQQQFCSTIKARLPQYFYNVIAVDVGSLDINGANRALFEDSLYLGVDLAPGRNVDFVARGHELALPDDSVDTVVSTECFEHDMFYPRTIQNIYRILKPGGLLVFTCATVGRAEHGTRRSLPQDAPLLATQGEWGDYYKNLTEEDIRSALDIDASFSEYEFQVNDESHDLYFFGIKRGTWLRRFDYSFIPYDRSARLFEDTGRGFRGMPSAVLGLDDPSVRHELNRHAFVFGLSGSADLRALRLVPIDAPAVVEVERLELETSAGRIDVLPCLRTNAAVVEGRTH